MEEVKELFCDYAPIYTKHTLEQGNVKTTYSTFLFGLITHVSYEDGADSYEKFYFEPERWIDAKTDGRPYIDSLDELMQRIHAIKSNVKKVKFRW